MNLLNKTCMSIHGLINPSVDYFAERCDAPEALVQYEVKEAKDFAADKYRFASHATDAAAHIVGTVEDRGFTAKTEILYDPTTLHDEPKPYSAQHVFEHERDTAGDTPILDYTPSKTYKGRFQHSHDTLHIPHHMITDEPPGLPRHHENEPVTRGIHGFPTIGDHLANDYHSRILT